MYHRARGQIDEELRWEQNPKIRSGIWYVRMYHGPVQSSVERFMHSTLLVDFLLQYALLRMHIDSEIPKRQAAAIR